MGQLGPKTWFNSPKPGPQSRDLSGTVCTLSIDNNSSLNWPTVSMLILFHFILFSNVLCILVHDYILCFIGSPCYNVSYYNYILVQPYYIVIHFIEIEDLCSLCKLTHISTVKHFYSFHCLQWIIDTSDQSS